MRITTRTVLWGLITAVSAGLLTAAEMPDVSGCGVIDRGDAVELHSPYFAFHLSTTDGLQAESWENRLTGRKLSLGDAPEVEFDIGLPEKPITTPKLRVLRKPPARSGEACEAVFELAAEDGSAAATVTYRWDKAQPVLRKFVSIANRSDTEWNRLLNVRLGAYCAEATITDREQGFPAYLDEQFFLSLAHPAGWAKGADGGVSLRQHPGLTLAPGAVFECMETVYGVAQPGAARREFVRHIRNRMRRVVRGHDKPYAIFEPFGARPDGNFDETEAFVLDNIAKLAQGQKEAGYQFDFYSVDFWVDYHGDLIRFHPQRFPNGLTKIREELRKLGTAPGLWIDSSWELWSIGGNPEVRPCLNYDLKRPETVKDASWGRPSFCRATEPIRSMYVNAFGHHIRENGVRLLKFDNLATTCVNPEHEHLPGIYSTEAIAHAVIEFLQALDRECPDVFLMLYWGYRSPWWLLHGDTLFDSGIGIEAASPSDFPSPYARDSITVKLDQAQKFTQDVPWLGKDSLGVWLSDWGWNSSVGKERWQEGFVMDICRGGLLAQPWSDTQWLSPPERQEVAEFLALLKARPECFGNPRFILGDPRNGEPYGYCCTDSRRAFLALNNCTWEDRVLTLQLNPAWGLPDGGTWDLYRWYPNPARLTSPQPTTGTSAAIALRPFDVALLEVVPAGEPASLQRAFREQPIPTGFPEASRAVEVSVEQPRMQSDPATSVWKPLEIIEAAPSAGATLAVQNDGSILAGGTNVSPDTYTITAQTELTGITGIGVEALPDPSLPGKGPGRAANGNFMLNEIRVTASPQSNPSAAVPISLRNPIADYSQHSYGGWPVAAAIDGDPNTGWSIDPAEGVPHVALFEAETPIGISGGTRLSFTLDQGEREHTLGRFRLSVTTAKPPFSIPAGYGPAPLVVKGRIPASPPGGAFVVTLELQRDGKPWALHNVGSHFSAQGTLEGKPVEFRPVLGKATYPAPWQAWRLEIGPSHEPRPFELTITTSGLSEHCHCQAHFIPR